MPKKMEPREQAAANGESQLREADEAAADFRVEDRRHWAAEGSEVEATEEEVAPTRPTLLEEYGRRAEQAEQRLQEYIEAFKSFRQEQEQARERLNRDVERRVALKFGELVADLLESADDLDRALSHADTTAEVASLAEGLELARKRFLAALERHGVERISPDGESFDPNLAEAVQVVPVDTEDKDGTVTETLRPGYRLGDHVIRAARVAVGRHERNGS